jgi:uroporphyrin-III C-methyltransferase
MNIFEVILNLEFLYLRHFSSRTTRRQGGQRDHAYHGHAPIFGFAATVMTCAKTMLYFWQGTFSLPLSFRRR